MPFINVQMLAGRTVRQKDDFMKEVAVIAQRTLCVPEQAVTIIINEVDHAHWSVGSRTMKEIQSDRVSD
ncbi:tautomerase family protein [Rhodanobacter sp. 7MK24]|uniref:tautomerase family protein n=1 Tax=Rhodanobacter sp. 7MK24 TaxID=2775922 RepID=UPI00177DD3F3|nr:tautomerase family protein [Rhodanobacter sp. 7MK24]